MGFWKVVGWLGVAAVGATAVSAVVGSDPVVVEKIVDGDTIDVRLDGETTRIRLLSVDTPEIGRNGKPSECLAEDARTYLESVLPVGTEVELEYDTERLDKYGRTLAGVYHRDTLVNAELAREGLAVAVDIAPNHRFYPEVKSAEAEAAALQKGISTLGPECFVAAEDAAVLRDAERAADEASDVGVLVANLEDDSNLSRAVSVSAKLAAAHTALSALDRAGDKQSEFQRAAYGDRYRERVAELRRDIGRSRSELDSAISREESRREKIRLENEARVAAERAAEEQRAAEQARRLEQEKAVAPSPATSGTGSGSAGGSGGKYTGCRAYGGNYSLNSVDDQGRRYAKIDCTTKAQIG